MPSSDVPPPTRPPHLGTVRLGTVRLGTVRLGTVRLGAVRLGTALTLGCAALALGCAALTLGCAAVPPPSTTAPGAAPVTTPPATSTPAPQAQASASDLTTLDLEARFGPYPVRDSAWAPNQPVLVGRDFDFATATALEGIGAGIAAANRQRDNRELAAFVGTQPPLTREALLALLLEECRGRCAKLNGQSVLIYGLLYGDQHARLRTVVEIEDAGSRVIYAAIGAAAPATELAEGARLRSEFAQGLRAVAVLLSAAAPVPAATPGLPPPTPPPSKAARCASGDGEGLKGRLLALTETHAELELAELGLPSFLHCPLEAFTEEPEALAGP